MTNDTPPSPPPPPTNPNVVLIDENALFPITVTAGDSKIFLFANGTLQGDPKKLKEGLASLRMKDNGIGAVVLWLLLRELTG